MLGILIQLVQATNCIDKQPFIENHQKYPFTLSDLPYPYDFLAPVITPQINKLHYEKHHQGYVNKLNTFLEQNPELQELSLLELLSLANQFDEIKNHAGGFYNHNLFWQVMTSPECQTQPSSALLGKIKEQWTYGLDQLLEEFKTKANQMFGSGWTFLCVDPELKLRIENTPNQQNPLMSAQEKYCNPIFGIDLWEHAYYLEYIWNRGTYIDEWVKIIDWDRVSFFYDSYASNGSSVPAQLVNLY